MPRRKRVDPVDAPIDGGETTKDVVRGKDPAKHYAYISQDDLGVARGRGMLQSSRDSGVKSDHDIHSEGPVQVGDLVLMEMSKEKKDAIENSQRAEFARRHKGERTNINRLMKRENDEVSFAGSRYVNTGA